MARASTKRHDRRPGAADSAPRPTGRAGGPPLPAWAHACFLLSGAAGLLYEIVWSKQFSLLLGNSLHAVATVVAAFLCGLALGAWALGRALARPGDGALRYARLELGVASLGLLSLLGPPLLGPLVGALAGALGAGTTSFATARAALVFVSLLPPTLLMGATLPVLVEHFEHGFVGAALARLYAVNTLGAVAGSWLGGFVLVPGLGLRATTLGAAALNALAALLAWRFGRRSAAATGRPAAGAPRGPEPAGGTTALPAGARAVVAVALALSGFAALAFQMAWVRLFGLLLGSSVYSFAGVLAVYLAGLAIGAALAGRAIPRLASLAGLGGLQVALAFAAAVSLWTFRSLPDRYLAIASATGADWTGLFLAQLVLVAAVILVPCVLLGAVFPLASRLLSTGDGGRAVGRAYAVNTLGTVAGSLVAGFVLIPALGVQGTHTFALGASLAAAALLLAAAARARDLRPAPAAGALAGALLAGLLARAAPAWDPAVMSAGLFRPSVGAWVESVTRGSRGSRVREAMARERVLFYREGLNGSVLVSRDTLEHDTVLRINGKADASDRDMLTQVLLGLVPGALADPGARTLVIGQGSGCTLGAVLAAGAGRTDLAEIERAVLAGSRFFQQPGHDPLDDPRVRVIADDARVVLEHARERYDLIVSEPSNPWLAGVNNLFTLDFYRLARRRLSAHGVFAQWIQLYEISPATLHSILAGFLRVFPRGQAFLEPVRADLILVACDRERPLSLARLRAPQVAGPLRRAGLLGPEAVAAFWIGPFDSLRVPLAGTTLNTDDRPIVEYRAPRDLVERSNRPAGDPQAPIAEMPLGLWSDARATFADWTPEQWHEARARQLARIGAFPRALAAAGDAAAGGAPQLAARLDTVIARERAEQALARLLPPARDAALAGRHEAARELLEQAAQVAPENGRVWVLLAEQQRYLGEPEAALGSLEHAIAVGSRGERRDAQLTAGLVEVGRGRMREAARCFALARTIDPGFVLAWTLEARARLDGGDRPGAALALHAGQALAPGDPALAGIARALGR